MGLNIIGQIIKSKIKYIFYFILLEILSMKIMDLTRDWISTFAMLCFTTPDSSGLSVGLSAFSFVFSK